MTFSEKELEEIHRNQWWSDVVGYCFIVVIIIVLMFLTFSMAPFEFYPSP